jgi:hypothetical protein
MRPRNTSSGDRTKLRVGMNFLETLQTLSSEFAGYLEQALDTADTMATGGRVEAAAAASDLSAEHAFAVRALFEAGAPNSASALLQLQFEAFLRSAWVLYAATDTEVAETGTKLKVESATSEKNVAGTVDMLTALERCQEAQPELRGLVVALRDMETSSSTALKGFIHGGLHPLARTPEGFPDAMAANLLKLSNAMLLMTAKLSARLTGSPEVLKKVEQSSSKFANALPLTVTAVT